LTAARTVRLNTRRDHHTRLPFTHNRNGIGEYATAVVLSCRALRALYPVLIPWAAENELISSLVWSRSGLDVDTFCLPPSPSVSWGRGAHTHTPWKGTAPSLAFENISDCTNCWLLVLIKRDGDTQPRVSAVHHHYHHYHLYAEHARYIGHSRRLLSRCEYN